MSRSHLPSSAAVILNSTSIAQDIILASRFCSVVKVHKINLEIDEKMAPSRKGTYKQYLDASRGALGDVPIPKSTWRGWLKSGKTTVAKLKEMGITVDVRKRKRTCNLELNDTSVENDLPFLDDTSNEQDLSQCSDASHSDQLAFSDSDSDISRNSSSSRSLLGSVLPSESSFASVHNTDESGVSDNDDIGDIPISVTLLRILRSKHLSPDALNERLHPHLPVSKFEVLLMILHLSMRHRMTDVFIDHQLQLIDQIVGIPNSLGSSKHLFIKLFQFGRKPTIHFYCPNCNVYLGTEKTFTSGDILCAEDNECEWSSTVSSHNEGNFFLTLGIREQLHDILSKSGIEFVAKERLHRVVSDIMDGKEYRKLSRKGKVLDNEDALTLTINTDSSPVFKSGPNSLWPVHLYINEIVPTQRFKADNILLGGLWFGKGETNIHMFLDPIVKELLELEELGVVWQRSDGKTIESPIFVICCCCDSVARPKVQNHIQFNGAFGCTICLHPNTQITYTEKVRQGVARKKKSKQGKNVEKEGDGIVEDVEVFKTLKTLRYLRGDYMTRTNLTLRDHMKLASVSAQRHIYGSTGISVMCQLSNFNVVYGFPLDYMHAILLGTMKKLANLWFDSTSSSEPYYIGLSVARVDSRLAFITLPSGFRPPRPMSDRVHWHANEWRAFLLYFGLPVLLNILPQVYYNNFKKLVVGIYILSKESMLNDEIDAAHNLLREFVWEFQDLYGEINMVFNIHATGHTAEVVAHMGPLWAYSAFPFESANGRLVKLAMGTKGVATQIARKFIMTKSVCKLLSHNYEANENVLNFCCNILGYSYLKNSSKGINKETLLGREFYEELTDVQKQAFFQKNIPVSSIALVVNRAVVGGRLFHGRQTTHQKKACDSCIRLISGEYALIDLIIVSSKNAETGLAETKFLITKLNVATDPSPVMVSHIKQCCLDSFGDVELISSEEISRKCIFFSCTDKNYISEISNFFETD